MWSLDMQANWSLGRRAEDQAMEVSGIRLFVLYKSIRFTLSDIGSGWSIWSRVTVRSLLCIPKGHVDVLTPGTCDCDVIWRQTQSS